MTDTAQDPTAEAATPNSEAAPTLTLGGVTDAPPAAAGGIGAALAGLWARARTGLRRLARIGRRLGMFAITLLGLLLVTFLIGRVIPIDPVLAVVGDQASAATYAEVRQRMALDEPVYFQFWLYLQDVLTGDFGISTTTSRPVLHDIARRFPATLELATIATLIGVLVGVPMGVVAATHRGRLLDHVLRLVSLVGYSAPVFWLGMIALLVFYSALGWTEGPGRIDVFYEDLVPTLTGVITVDAALAGNWQVFKNAVAHLILPAAVLGYFSMAYITRMTRSLMIEQLAQEYVFAARARGVPQRHIVWRHALRNAAVPLVTVIALTYASLLEGSVLTETVFAWPGLGAYLTSSLLNADMNGVLGATAVVGLVFLTVNMFSDVIYGRIDVRAKSK